MFTYSPNSPIVNAGALYANGLQMSWLTNTTMQVAAGAARNSSDVNDIILPAAVTINGATVGANGVDVAVLADSSWYAVYVIGDSTDYQPAAALLSLNFSQPNLPFGYDMYRRVGSALTSSGGNLLKFWQYGSDEWRVLYWDAGISVTTSNETSFTALSLAAGVPPLAVRAMLDLTYTAASAGNVAQFLPYGSSASVGIVRFGTGVAAAQVGDVLVPTELDAGAPTVLYKLVTSDTMTTLIIGYEDYL